MKRASIDPSTGAVVGHVTEASPDDVRAAVARARAAQPAWAARSLGERAALLRPLAADLEVHAEALAQSTTAEMGKPLADARAEADTIFSRFDAEVDEVVDALSPEVRRTARVHSTIVRDPLGVAACITPWNFPLLMPHEQLLPALLAGNTVVFKPSEETPLTGDLLASLWRRHLPPDVLLVVHGDERAGVALVAADVDLIAFTGSREAGRAILGEASRTFKRVVLELGGKDPLLVLDDADLGAAAQFAARNAFRNAGQVCVATERILVTEGRRDAFVDRLVAAAGSWSQGDGRTDGVRVGPMVHARQRTHVASLVSDALAKGARVAWQGPDLGGNFFPPTVLVDVTNDMRIATEETFGPVAAVSTVPDEDAAIREANAGRYGLGAVIFGEPTRARAIASRLAAGMVGINQSVAGAPGTPWVGARESGYGFHSGADGHRQFAQTRVISEPVGS